MRIPAAAAQLQCVPITIAPRVLLDLASRLPPEELARACHEAWATTA